MLEQQYSHKLLVERGRWVKPKINYCDRLCTLCHKHDIQDEYHALMICSRYESLRKKYLCIITRGLVFTNLYNL